MAASSTSSSEPGGGIWIGIDLGTSNCTCAVWDSTRGHPKWIRLGRLGLANPQANGKDGRIVPSAVLFFSKDDQKEKDSNSGDLKRRREQVGSEILSYNSESDNNKSNSEVMVGSAALNVLDNVLQSSTTTKTSEEEVLPSYSAQEVSASLVTSVKRLLGVSKLQDLDPEIQKSLPLALAEDVEGNILIPVAPVHTTKSGVHQEFSLYPIQVTAILLRSIRLAAQDYIHRNARKKKLKIPGYEERVDEVRNCVVGVPVYYGRKERQLTEKACRMAGFDGHVSTVTESTAAAMAYGLFVGEESSSSKKSVLVFDMGGGTTDVTIAEMLPPQPLSSNIDKSDDNENIDSNNDNSDDDSNEEEKDSDVVTSGDDHNHNFRVVVTEGDGKLGGDDMDHLLMELVVQKLQVEFPDHSFDPLTNKQRRTLLQLCKNVKERLCGESDDSSSSGSKATTNKTEKEKSCTIPFEGYNIVVDQQEFETAISPLVNRARSLVELAVRRYADQRTSASTTTTSSSSTGATIAASAESSNTNELVQMHEVILIGGSSKVPAIRRMLREVFPPPIPPELCTSVNSMSAVAQGAAIQAALRSNLVKKHELRSAMMLDTNPHAIGVLTGGKVDQEQQQQQQQQQKQNFIQILSKDAPLPAKGYATFRLANADQPGITIQAVEKVIDSGRNDNESEQSYQNLGEFTFLLHRLSKEQQINQLIHSNGERTVDVGMTLETDGKFIVSIFDPLDPEHVQKRKFFQRTAKTKDNSKDAGGDGATLDYKLVAAVVNNNEGITREEILLLLAIVVVFIFYLVVKLTLQESPEESAKII